MNNQGNFHIGMLVVGMVRDVVVVVAIVLLLTGCTADKHFRVVGPASVNITSPVGNVNVVIEEGGSYDSHPAKPNGHHVDHAPKPAATKPKKETVDVPKPDE